MLLDSLDLVQQSHNNEVIVCEQFSGKHQPVGLLLENVFENLNVLRALMELKTLLNRFKTFATVFQLYFSIFTSTCYKKINFKILLKG